MKVRRTAHLHLPMYVLCWHTSNNTQLVLEREGLLNGLNDILDKNTNKISIKYPFFSFLKKQTYSNRARVFMTRHHGWKIYENPLDNLFLKLLKILK
jgi:hypothetical protein